MGFRDLDEFLRVEPIRLPIRGKTYEFPGAISGRAGLVLQRIVQVVDDAQRKGDDDGTADAAEVLSDDAELNLRRELLGDREQEMADDGLTTAHVEHAFRTLIVWHTAGPEAAERAWEAMAVPRDPEASPRQSAPVKSSRSPASPAGSTNRRKPSARRGGTSSSTGT